MRDFGTPANEDRERGEAAPTLGGTRAQAVQRLQIGLAGLGTMVLMIALANVVMDQANQADSAAVPEAASTVAAEPSVIPQVDPLAEAGVVPDLPATPTPTPTQEQAILPEQGDVAPSTR
jgi:hypothetical protein